MMWFKKKPKTASVPSFTRWEYQTIPMTSRYPDMPPDIVEQKELLDVMGAVGWELVTVLDNCLIFKKPVHAEAR
jgi:hypothetical protein